MSIDRFFTILVAVTRMHWHDESSSETTVGSIYGHVQQAQPDYVEQLGEVWGRVFILWCDKAEDLLAGDTLTISSGDYSGTYSVKSIQLNATGSHTSESGKSGRAGITRLSSEVLAY